MSSAEPPVDAAWVALSLTKHMGGKTFINLVLHFNYDLPAILNASPQTIRKVPGIGEKIAAAITQIDMNAVQAAITRWQSAGVRILTTHSPAYPRRLRTLKDAPPTLFVRGKENILNPPKTVAIIGTRNPSEQAKLRTYELALEFSRRNYIVVSGMAFGIDKAAHLSTLSSYTGQTIAVLGNGILTPYPSQHREIAESIMARGALLCEVAPDAAVSTPGLVARNRLITGMADVVIVSETAADGGAMHAVRFARAQKRPVYTLDLPASGNRALIDSGATPIALDLSDLDNCFK